MPNNPTLSFDPTAFFEKTAYYASQGRFVFKLDNLPKVLRDEVNNIGQVFLAQDILTRGLVARAVTIPASTLGTYEEFSFSGPTRKHAHSQIFGPLTVEFLLMGRLKEEASAIYNTFMLWHEKIISPVISGSDQTPTSDNTLFSVEYYQNYISSKASLLVLSPYGKDNTTDGLPILHTEFFEIYPQSVGGLTLSWENEDAPLVMPVTFEYYYSKVANNIKMNIQPGFESTQNINPLDVVNFQDSNDWLG